MDVLVLIDKLDDLVHNAKAVPLTDQVRIDREEIYDILDQMRATIPEEIKQARWIVKERQEMLAEAKREQDRLLGRRASRPCARPRRPRSSSSPSARRRRSSTRHAARRARRGSRWRTGPTGSSSTLEINLDKFLDRGAPRPRAAARALAGDRRGRHRPDRRRRRTAPRTETPRASRVPPDDGGRRTPWSPAARSTDAGARRYPDRHDELQPAPGEAPSGRGAPRGARGRARAVRVRRPALPPGAGAGRAPSSSSRGRSRAPSSRSRSRRGSTAPATAASATRCSTCRSTPASTRRPSPDDEELRTPYLVDDQLEVSAWARDAVALALPDKILCRPDCAGLCPVCGKNLNDEPHEHEERAADPRWAALEALREDG